jgi:uncharacterized YigZ family protein
MQHEVTSYKTIKKRGEGLFKDKGSKFIALAIPVETEEEVKSALEEVRNAYHDARHHCYAYRLGPLMDIYRANDDGEPSSSAGKPILGQIRSYELTNILIVVVRYFGGTLLGVGGLINAYKTAASQAIEDTKIIEHELHDYYDIFFEYPDMNDVMRILKEETMQQVDQAFDTSCRITIKVKRGFRGKVFTRLDLLDSCKIEHKGTY